MVERALFASVLLGFIAILVANGGPVDLFHTTAAKLGDDAMSVETTSNGDANTEVTRSVSPEEQTVQIVNQNRAFDVACLGVSVGIACLSLLLHWRKRAEAETDDECETEETEVSSDARDNLFNKRQEIYRILSNDLHHLFDGRILVKDVMSRNLQMVETTASRDEVESLMKKNRLHHLMVCKNGRLEGVISTNDLYSKSGPRAQDIMTADPISVEIDEEITGPISTIVNHRIACLPAVEDGHLRGVISKTDLLVTLQCAIRVLHEIGDIMSGSIFKGHENEKVSSDEIHKEFWKSQVQGAAGQTSNPA